MIQGLSPLARGNLVGNAAQLVELGPIPARAGQPATARMAMFDDYGLSPLARGNPRRAATHPPAGRAYPRSRGATGMNVLVAFVLSFIATAAAAALVLLRIYGA